MEHLWGQSTRVESLMGSENAGSRLVPTGAVVFGHQQTCSRVYANKTDHDFVHHEDIV